MLDDSEEALAQLIEIDLLAQRRGEGFDGFDRLTITNVEAPLNERLDKRTQRFKYDCPGERSGNKDDMGSIRTGVREQYAFSNDAVVDERQADGEQEVKQRTIEDHVESIVPGIVPGAGDEEAQEHREQDESVIGTRDFKKRNEEECRYDHAADDAYDGRPFLA